MNFVAVAIVSVIRILLCLNNSGQITKKGQALIGLKELQYGIPKIKMLCNLRCLKARLRLLCNKLSTAQQPEPRFKIA